MYILFLIFNGGYSKLVFCYFFVDVEEGMLMFLLRIGSVKLIDIGVLWRKCLCLFFNFCSWWSCWIVWWMLLVVWLEVRFWFLVIVLYIFCFCNMCLNSFVFLELRNIWFFFVYFLFRKKGILRKFFINC